MADGETSPREYETELASSPTSIADGDSMPRVPSIVDPSDYTVHDIMEDDDARLWLKNLPETWKAECTRPLDLEELADMRQTAQIVTSKPIVGRRPKMVIELGCAGAGKSSRISECFDNFGVDGSNIVLADGDLVRASHRTLREILTLTKGSMLQKLEREGHSSLLKVYSDQMVEYSEDTRVGFQDCGEWCYTSSGGMKEQLCREAIADNKDVLITITAAKTYYVEIIKHAIQQGYEVHVATLCVQPSVLLKRQVQRAHSTGRLPTIDPMITDGNLYWNTVLKQQKVIEGLPGMLEMAYKSGGSAMVFDNTPDFDTHPKMPPLYESNGYSQPRCRFPGKGTLEGLVKHLRLRIQKTPPYVRLMHPPPPARKTANVSGKSEKKQPDPEQKP